MFSAIAKFLTGRSVTEAQVLKKNIEEGRFRLIEVQNSKAYFTAMEAYYTEVLKRQVADLVVAEARTEGQRVG